MSDIDKRASARARWALKVAMVMAERIDKARGSWGVASRIEEISLHFDGYAEPGYSTPTGIITTGNWNAISIYNRETKEHVDVSNLPDRLSKIFEGLGIEIEWSDEWSTCSNCNKLVRTSPDSYSYQPSYFIDDCGITCHECVKEDPSAYLEFLDGNDNSCETIGLNLTEHGYTKVNEDSFESGWQPWQNDSPKKVAANLRNEGVDHFIFQLDESSQFYSKWSVFKKIEEETE